MSSKYLEISKTKEQNNKLDVESYQSKVRDLLMETMNRHFFSARISKTFSSFDTHQNDFSENIGSVTKLHQSFLENLYNIYEENTKQKISKPDPSELSDYVITSEGVVNENWTSTVSLPSQIIEVNQDFVILECLIDYEKRILEKRKFKKSILEQKCRLILSNIILLKISEKPGKIQFEFEDAMNLGYDKYFSISEYISDFDSIDTGKFIK